MRWSFAGVAVIALGLIGLALLLLFQNITTKNEHDYYLLKEVMNAAMLDSIDIEYRNYTGEIKIMKEKFVENFIRRYAEVASLNTKGYKIEFFDIIETPPKASIRVTQKSTAAGAITEEFDVVNELNAMLETNF